MKAFGCGWKYVCRILQQNKYSAKHWAVEPLQAKVSVKWRLSSKNRVPKFFMFSVSPATLHWEVVDATHLLQNRDLVPFLKVNTMQNDFNLVLFNNWQCMQEMVYYNPKFCRHCRLLWELHFLRFSDPYNPWMICFLVYLWCRFLDVETHQYLNCYAEDWKNFLRSANSAEMGDDTFHQILFCKF